MNIFRFLCTIFRFFTICPSTTGIGWRTEWNYGNPMVGASGAIFGVVAAFATLYPDAKIGIMFIPIPC
jgi:membrane associated rhomboid family serine protease